MSPEDFVIWMAYNPLVFLATFIAFIMVVCLIGIIASALFKKEEPTRRRGRRLPRQGKFKE